MGETTAVVFVFPCQVSSRPHRILVSAFSADTDADTGGQAPAALGPAANPSTTAVD
jgi:hypothetical protein